MEGFDAGVQKQKTSVTLPRNSFATGEGGGMTAFYSGEVDGRRFAALITVLKSTTPIFSSAAPKCRSSKIL